MSPYAIAKGEGGPAVYRQIGEILGAEIRDFHRGGDMLPSEGALAERFGVNRHTVRRAVEELIASGSVERIHGRGIFVLEPAISYAIGSVTRFTENLEAQGHKTDSQVLRKGAVPARGGVAERLSVEEGQAIALIETVRRVDGRPFCLISHFLPLPKFQVLLDSYKGGSLHQTIDERLAIRLRRRDSLISAVLPKGDDATHLKMPRNAPVLRVKSLNLEAETGEPAEYAVTRFRGEAIELSVKP